jgi:hypothetical protein
MSHDPLREALRGLPRERAGEAFTERVLARLDEPVRRRPGLAHPFALAAVVAAALAGGWLWREQALDRQRLERISELKRQQRMLAAELESIRRDAAATAVPVVYLGGDDSTDVVVDIARLAERRAGTGVVPASLERRAPAAGRPY